VGAVSSDVVALETRKHAQQQATAAAGPLGKRVVLKPDAVDVEVITVDDRDADAIMTSLGQLTRLPKTAEKSTLVHNLTRKLTELI